MHRLSVPNVKEEWNIFSASGLLSEVDINAQLQIVVCSRFGLRKRLAIYWTQTQLSMTIYRRFEVRWPA
jgi:hypothetical protein